MSHPQVFAISTSATRRKIFPLEHVWGNQTKDQATLDLQGFAKDGRPQGTRLN